MSQSLTRLYAHIVFSTKHRFPFLHDRELRNEFHQYIGGVIKTLESHPLRIGGIDNHIHILCNVSKNSTVSALVGETKRISSLWIKKRAPDLSRFYWQKGYGAFSVSEFHVKKIIRYIENQEIHHKTDPFENEYLRLLDENGVEYDQRYVWD